MPALAVVTPPDVETATRKPSAAAEAVRRRGNWYFGRGTVSWRHTAATADPGWSCRHARIPVGPMPGVSQGYDPPADRLLRHGPEPRRPVAAAGKTLPGGCTTSRSDAGGEVGGPPARGRGNRHRQSSQSPQLCPRTARAGRIVFPALGDPGRPPAGRPGGRVAHGPLRRQPARVGNLPGRVAGGRFAAGRLPLPAAGASTAAPVR